MRKLLHSLFKKGIFLLPVLVCLFMTPQSYAQELIEVTGTVTDEGNIPIPGVTVQTRGSNQGVVTDFDGNYSIQTPENSTLIFTYIGFETREIPVEGKLDINVLLRENVSALGEVVVTGYGSTRKEEITSAITTIDVEEFNQGNINSPENLLSGKVPGLVVSKAGGDPNQPFTIRLRGLSTFGANSQPLVVLDGIVGSSLDAVDPNDIESISVLKDASAGAIYGTRGSSGVLIITSKAGKGNAIPSFEYRVYTAIESISNSIPVANREQFLAAGGPDLGANTNWLDEISTDGISQVHNLSFTNSTAGGLNYRASLNYRDINGVLNGTGFQRINARINITQRLLDDKLKVTGIVSTSDRDADIGFSQAMRFALNFIPTAPIFENRTSEQLGRDPNQFGGYFETGVQDVYNPVAINNLSQRKRDIKILSANFRAELEILEGFNIATNYSNQTTNTLGGEYFANTALFGGVIENGVASQFNEQSTDNLFEFTTTYNSSFENFKYDFLGGYSFQKFDFKRLYAYNTDFITNEVGFDNMGIGEGINNQRGNISSDRTEAKLSAFFSRLNLNYKELIFSSASIRREASSRFGANNRWGNFWAVSAGLGINKLMSLKSIDQLKLRVGYGVTGNEPAVRYAFTERLGRIGSGYANGNFIPAISPVSNPNPDLKWEEKGELNIGLDFTVLNYRFSGSFNYFNRNTKDLLNTIQVPSPPNLFGTSLVNLGELETNGFEAQLNYTVFDGDDFSWDLGGNFTTFKTVLVNFNNQDNFREYRGNLGSPGLNGTEVILVEEGERLGQIRAGVFAGYNEEGKSLVINQETGEPTTERNLDRDGVIVGNGLPDFTFGLTNTLRYKNFDLNFLFRGAVGHSLVNIQRVYFEHPSNVGRQNFVKTKYFREDDTEQDAYSSNQVEKADFVRLDNATLGYNISLPEDKSITDLRVYLSSNNLFTITGYSGSDPEVRYSDQGPIEQGDTSFTYGGDILVSGIDRRATYFPTRTITLGLNIKF